VLSECKVGVWSVGGQDSNATRSATETDKSINKKNGGRFEAMTKGVHWGPTPGSEFPVHKSSPKLWGNLEALSSQELFNDEDGDIEWLEGPKQIAHRLLQRLRFCLKRHQMRSLKGAPMESASGRCSKKEALSIKKIKKREKNMNIFLSQIKSTVGVRPPLGTCTSRASRSLFHLRF